jgi:hypothetical protein
MLNHEKCLEVAEGRVTGKRCVDIVVMMGIWGLFLGFRGFSGLRRVFLGSWGLMGKEMMSGGLPRKLGVGVTTTDDEDEGGCCCWLGTHGTGKQHTKTR